MNQMMQAEENNSESNAGHDQPNQNKENEEIKSSPQQVSEPPQIESNLVHRLGLGCLTSERRGRDIDGRGRIIACADCSAR